LPLTRDRGSSSSRQSLEAAATILVERRFAMLSRKGQDLLAVAALMVILAVAGTLAMIRIDVSQRLVDPASRCSRHGSSTTR
jgi:hypothetical protein